MKIFSSNCETKKPKKISMEGLFDFFGFVGRLKEVQRTGWVLRGVPKPETVSSHSHRMAVMAMSVPSLPPPDQTRLIKMALVHDLAESVVGDLVPGAVPKAEKAARELSAMRQITDSLPADLRGEILSLFEEYEAGASTVARLCKDIDKLDMLVQAFEYEEAGMGSGSLQDFFDSTEGKIATDFGRQVLAELHRRREAKQRL